MHRSDYRQRRRGAQVVAEMLGQLKISEEWLENPGDIEKQEVQVKLISI